MSQRAHSSPSSTLASFVHDRTGISVSRCYQCGKCSAGCPAAAEMDMTPSVLLHMLQTEQTAADTSVLGSYTIWLCLSCHTCVTRCPMEVDLPRVMDALRMEAMRRRSINPRARDIVAFHTSFLNTIRRFGRLWEVGLIGEYKLRTLHFWQDVLTAPGMLTRGKLALFPHRTGNTAGVRKLFAHAEKEKRS